MISDRIRELRVKADLSQTELAQKLGLTRASVNAWEMGISVPSTQFVISLARLFSVSTDFILDLNEESYISTEGLNLEQVEIIRKLLEHFNNANNKE